MLNFLFGTLCAGGALFGILLTYTGVSDQTYEAVTAGGVYLFGSLLTFGIGQLTRAKNRKQKQRPVVPLTPASRTESPQRAEPALFPVTEPENQPPAPHPVLERVASRFARPGQ